MQAQTRHLIEQMRSVSFFAQAGTCPDEHTTALRTWRDAAAANRSKQWDWVLMEACNVFTQRLHDRCRDRFQKWNDLVDEIKPLTQQVVSRIMETVPIKGKDRVLIEATLNWTLLEICMEKEYGEEHAPPFYRQLWQWYQRGHFPCGWDGVVDPGGDYDKTIRSGKLIVY
jgi:hypothetical protein